MYDSVTDCEQVQAQPRAWGSAFSRQKRWQVQPRGTFPSLIGCGRKTGSSQDSEPKGSPGVGESRWCALPGVQRVEMVRKIIAESCCYAAPTSYTAPVC